MGMDIDELYDADLNLGYQEHMDSAAPPTSETAPVAEDANPIRLCVITSKGRLSKLFERDSDGTVRVVRGGSMFSGDGRNTKIKDLGRLAALIATLTPQQALTFGRHIGPNNPIHITTEAELEKVPGETTRIARTREHFAYPDGSPGVLLLDYDLPKDVVPAVVPLTPAEYWDALVAAAPSLDGREHLIISSASSYIYGTGDGAELIGAGGLHCFVTVTNAADIPRIGESITARLWLAGHGRFETTKGGQTVKRSLVDASVWQPERLSFDAGAACGEGLDQRRPAPLYVPGGMLSLADVVLTGEEQPKADKLMGIRIRAKKPKDATKPEPANHKEIAAALSCVPADIGYEKWLKIGLALCTLGDTGFDLWDEWSGKGKKYPGRANLEKKWASFDPNGPVSIGTLFHIAEQCGFQRGGVLFADALVVPPDADTLFIVPGEDVARQWIEAGHPCIGIPNPWGWSKGAEEPSDVFAATVSGVLKEHPTIRVVTALFSLDGAPRPWSKGDDGARVDVPMPGRWVSDSATVTHAAYRLAEALRALPGVNIITTARFFALDNDFGASFVKSLKKALKLARAAARLLDDPIFCGASLDPDALGQKGAASAEMAYCSALDGKRVGVADGLLYEWAGSHWALLQADRLERAAHGLIVEFFTATGGARKISDAPKAAVSAPHLQPIPSPARWMEVGGAIIPCLDVTLDIAPDGKITAREPNRNDGLRYCVNATWKDKDKPSPEFDRFIQNTLPDPAVRRLVQQYVGYTLISDTRFQVAQWWFGNGANGKGFLAQIVAALHRKVAAADIEDLGGFGAENLIDASLITVDETPKRIDEQRLKSAISGDDLNINRKYQVPVTVRLRAKWLLRGNDKPALSDQTDGLWRRLQIIEFTEKFDGANRDDMLADRIVENELPGVLRWAVEGLVMLLQAGGFKNIPESVQASKNQMQVETDNVLGWWTDKDVRVCDAPRTSRDSAYRSYSLWCKDNGMMPLGSPRFWVRVKAIMAKLGLKLVEMRPQETTTDPFSGSSQVVRPRKLNLDITSGQQDVDGEGTTVVPLAPKAKGFGVSNMKQHKTAVQHLGDIEYEELDAGEDFDLSSIPF
ncbi:hypothetical protein HAP94_18515 [Acidithiobacillus ferrivorans]|nr:hypothetical protein [Acidithiobacillus ferrivorans]